MRRLLFIMSMTFFSESQRIHVVRCSIFQLSQGAMRRECGRMIVLYNAQLCATCTSNIELHWLKRNKDIIIIMAHNLTLTSVEGLHFTLTTVWATELKSLVSQS